MLADDTTLFLADINSLKIAISTFNKFQNISGLKINIAKTEIIPIGNQQNKNIVLPIELSSIQIKHGPFKALGVWYSYNEEEITELNLTNRLKNIQTLINIWRSRHLSLKGKITIIKTLIIPQVQFIFSMIYIPDHILIKLDKILFEFLWDAKPAKIKKSTIIAPISEGGLGMIDINSTHQAAKIGWIRRLNSNTNDKWKSIMLIRMGIKSIQLNKKLDCSVTKHNTKFYTQVLSAWLDIYNQAITTLDDILNEYILYNQLIKIEKNMLNEKYLDIQNTNLQIFDLLDTNGKFLTLTQLKQTTNSDLTQMKYNSLISAIPKTWKHIIKDKFSITDNTVRISHEPYLKINTIQKPLSKITNKQIYLTLISKHIKPPTAIDTWINIFPFLELQDWTTIYRTSFEVTKEPYLQSFQYKIINRVLNCKERLYKWKITDNNKCYTCEEVDSIEHHLFYCKQSITFWLNIKKWMISNLDFGFEFTICEVLFGFPKHVIDSDLLNFIILMGKWYINKNKSEEKSKMLFEFLVIIKKKLELMIKGSEMVGRKTKSWHDTLLDVL